MFFALHTSPLVLSLRPIVVARPNAAVIREHEMFIEGWNVYSQNLAK